jgi:hypothetical protein
VLGHGGPRTSNVEDVPVNPSNVPVGVTITHSCEVSVMIRRGNTARFLNAYSNKNRDALNVWLQKGKTTSLSAGAFLHVVLLLYA